MEWVEECNGQAVTPLSSGKRKHRPKRFQYVGWGSKQLIEFLGSLNKDTSIEISQNDVAKIISKYVADNKLVGPEKKKRIVCDDRLFMLFGKKTISKNRVHDLLERHYAENGNDSDYDFLYDLDDDERQRSCGSEKRAPRKREAVPKSSFAAIVKDNIKLLYLRRSLVQELVKDSETFESKMLGSFVRIKSDPNDYLQKNPYQIVQVTGVKKGHGTDDFLLQVTNHLKDVSIPMLSDGDFSQEECEDLHQRVKNGFLKRPTVVDMVEKVRGLHEDVTKHWLERELASLQRLIDHANEKGWRRELFEYLEKRDQLKNEEEQSRLLRGVPEVIAEELEPAHKEHSDDDEEIKNGLVRPNHELVPDPHQSDKEQQLSDSAIPEISKILDDKKQPEKGFLSSILQENLDIPKLANGKEQQNDCFIISSLKAIPEIPTFVMVPDGRSPTCNASPGDIHLNNGVQAQSKAPEVIELSDDDDDDNKIQDPRYGNGTQAYHDTYDIAKITWFYKDPQGITRGPFSLAQLKQWSDADYFPPDFMVWMTEQSQESAILLADVLRRLQDQMLFSSS
ncbi:PREDICTED: uncharacterized protein At5g08430 isoform X2 [Tarenaya hassleriana]|uniref:uncharacterized protein At5g08430 isoform X2 n=1 Tax=Tarenaya hassleriana TaxID=28532 RepID=UPI00053C8108|nr:PREDICTED: uncharacterized protein At5g08430 isoform X2 [Tarenaya hassleriana]